MNSRPSSLLILGTFHYPVCFPLNSFLRTTEKPQSLSNKPGPLWQGPRTLLQYWGSQNARLTLPCHIPSPHLQAGHLRTFPIPSSNSGEWGAPSPVSGFGVGPASLGLAAEASRCGGLPLQGPPPGGKPIPTPLPSSGPCQRLSPRRAPMGDTEELPNTALRGLKMQHPKQGLKMQSWGWAGKKGRCPDHGGILPLPSAVLEGQSAPSARGS